MHQELATTHRTNAKSTNAKSTNPNNSDADNDTSSQARTTTSADADHHAHNLTNWLQEYDQLADGQFFGQIDEVALDGLQVFREHTSKALRQQCNVWPDAIWLGISADDADCRINGQQLGQQQIMCRPGDCDFELVTPDDFDIFGLVIRQDALLAAANNEELALKGLSLSDHPRLNIPQPTLLQVRERLNALLSPDTPALHQRLQRDMILSTLLTLLQQETPARKAPPSYEKRKRVVDTVKGWMEHHPNTPVTMTELCELTHVSRRTLQYSFESILGISPLKFLRTARLNNVRRDLKRRGHDQEADKHSYPISVASIATEWGFWHPGQFAHDYKQLFGENPSETLQRHTVIQHG
jgi:AraC family ethanolamine operon transcriptional activator